jgi:hypothetical protein
MKPVSNDFAPYAFSVVLRSFISKAFPHELGHNMGAHHDRGNAPSPGAYDYSYGYYHPGQNFGTIMSYPGFFIPHFSNPLVDYNGVPTGIPEGDSNSADNAKTLNNTASTVSLFRQCNDDYTVLTVTKSGMGTGTVTSSPAGIDCGGDCSEGYPLGTNVTLTATPNADSTFAGWGGIWTAQMGW